MRNIGILVFIVILAVIFSRTYQSISLADRVALESAVSHPDMVAKVRILAKKKGARAVYDLLRKIHVPNVVNKHSLGHVVGDILYQQERLGGLTACVLEYRNACVHAVVAQALIAGGDRVISDLASVCRRQEVTPIDMPSCFHGIGHGLMAYTGYSMATSLDFCQQFNPGSQDALEFRECLGGVFMEFVIDDSHDRTMQTRAQEKYLALTDTLYPCANSMSTLEEKKACYHYLPPFLIMKASGTVGSLRFDPQILSLALGFCNTVADESDRKSCFGGFGTQFLLSGVNEDMKIISNVEEERFRRVIEQCRLAPTVFGSRACIGGAVESILWGAGKVAPAEDAAVGMCQLIGDINSKEECFLDTIEAYFVRPKNLLSRQFCDKFPLHLQTRCLEAYENKK